MPDQTTETPRIYPEIDSPELEQLLSAKDFFRVLQEAPHTDSCDIHHPTRKGPCNCFNSALKVAAIELCKPLATVTRERDEARERLQRAAKDAASAVIAREHLHDYLRPDGDLAEACKRVLKALRAAEQRAEAAEKRLEFESFAFRQMCALTESIAKECGVDTEKAEPPDVMHGVIALRQQLSSALAKVEELKKAASDALKEVFGEANRLANHGQQRP